MGQLLSPTSSRTELLRKPGFLKLRKLLRTSPVVAESFGHSLKAGERLNVDDPRSIGQRHGHALSPIFQTAQMRTDSTPEANVLSMQKSRLRRGLAAHLLHRLQVFLQKNRQSPIFHFCQATKPQADDVTVSPAAVHLWVNA